PGTAAVRATGPAPGGWDRAEAPGAVGSGPGSLEPGASGWAAGCSPGGLRGPGSEDGRAGDRRSGPARRRAEAAAARLRGGGAAAGGLSQGPGHAAGAPALGLVTRIRIHVCMQTHAI